MPTWLFWRLRPGAYKKWKLEAARKDALSSIRGERLNFETMVQRAQRAGDTPDDAFVQHVLQHLTSIQQRAIDQGQDVKPRDIQPQDIEELERLEGDAEQQGQLRAYICPDVEIEDEGNSELDLMREWKVPQPIIDTLRSTAGQKLKAAKTDLKSARAALRHIFEESDSWSRYTSEYEEEMRRYTWWLFCATIVLLLLAILAFHFLHDPLTGLAGLIFAGAAGSCVSVITKMPLLEVGLSGELEAYGRRIFSRIGVGVIASVIGSGLLGWGLVSIAIQGTTFADALNACICPTPSCSALRTTLILLAVPMLFGFSERALASFERAALAAFQKG
jgi:hypothetical protein